MRAPIDFDEIKRLIPIRWVLEHCGIAEFRRGWGDVRSTCPFCTKSGHFSRRFAVRGPEWYCHFCEIGGDVVLLWSKLYGLSTGHAAINLCEHFKIDVPRRDVPNRTGERRCP